MFDAQTRDDDDRLSSRNANACAVMAQHSGFVETGKSRRRGGHARDDDKMIMSCTTVLKGYRRRLRFIFSYIRLRR